MSRWSIFKSIGIEGLLISFLGGIMGIQMEYIYVSLAVAITIGILTSFIAAVNISRMNMVDSL